MMQSRRNDVQRVARHETSHAGLWLDKYMSERLMRGEAVAPDKPTPQAELVAAVSDLDEPEIYRGFFNIWKQSLKHMGAITRTAKVQGRLSVGLGGEAVLETAITLHRTYGVPYIPGSALKGLVANYARNKLDEDAWGVHTIAYKTMFGNTKSAGYVMFFDALYVPGSGHQDSSKQPKPLWADVITVHHPKYYQGDAAPADWDSPNPVPFLSATGEYLLAIGGPAQWVDKAFEILALALVEEGVGAKTSSGYGRMAMEGAKDAHAAADGSASKVSGADPEQAIVEQYRIELEQMSTQSVASQIPTVAQRWQTLEISQENKLLIAQLILDRVEKSGRTKKSLGKPWFEELRRYVKDGK